MTAAALRQHAIDRLRHDHRIEFEALRGMDRHHAHAIGLCWRFLCRIVQQSSDLLDICDEASRFDSSVAQRSRRRFKIARGFEQGVEPLRRRSRIPSWRLRAVTDWTKQVEYAC